MDARFLKTIARSVFGDYALYRIFRCDTTAEARANVPDAEGEIRRISRADLEASGQSLIREQAWYTGDGSVAYGFLQNERIVGACFYWFGSRYLAERNFIPLSSNDAKLVQIVTVAEMRGHGVASRLIEWSARDMFAGGFVRLYARIWFTNRASVRAFQKAGWRKAGLILELNPFRKAKPLRIGFRTGPSQ